MPPHVRERVYTGMLKVSGRDGVFIVVYWNGNMFGNAVQHFYHKNPQLCGEFDGSAFDLNTCTLTTSSGSCTHWTTPAEAAHIFQDLNVDIIELKERENGILVAARANRANSPSPPRRINDGQ